VLLHHRPQLLLEQRLQLPPGPLAIVHFGQRVLGDRGELAGLRERGDGLLTTQQRRGDDGRERHLCEPVHQGRRLRATGLVELDAG
jgi:hypothetical protein